jgi:hypothetical protein
METVRSYRLADGRDHNGAGDTAMSAVSHTFALELTKKQTDLCRAAWNKAKKSGGMLVMNLRTECGPFALAKANLVVGVFDAQLMEELGIVIEAHKKARP